MKTKIEFTTAEKSLSTMATVVLVLGLVGSIVVFFGNCFIWERSSYSGEIKGIEGFNWLGLSSLIYIVMATLLSWSLLSIIAEIAVNIRKMKEGNGLDWQKEFALLVLLHKKEEAKKILYKEILDSTEFKSVLSGGREEYHNDCIKTLNNKFSVYLKAIGEHEVNIEAESELLNVFK